MAAERTPDAATAVFVQEAFRHHKTIAVIDQSWLAELGIDSDVAGVTISPDDFFTALAEHRHWAR